METIYSVTYSDGEVLTLSDCGRTRHYLAVLDRAIAAGIVASYQVKEVR